MEYQALGFDEGYFMVLQAYYYVKMERLKMRKTPDLSKFRKALFWAQTSIRLIDNFLNQEFEYVDLPSAVGGVSFWQGVLYWRLR